MDYKAKLLSEQRTGQAGEVVAHRTGNVLETGQWYSPASVLMMIEDALAASVVSDDALLRQALAALEHHREQTRPIDRTHAAIAALRARVLPNVPHERLV